VCLNWWIPRDAVPAYLVRSVRWFLLGLMLAACKRDPGDAQRIGSSAVKTVPAVPPPIDGGTTPAMVELLHATPSTIRVSSRVANKAIVPAQIADHDFSTAWNSRTGDLVGAWVDVAVPGAQIVELRFTVGHTGKGSHGEDYFTMNPRIRKVTLLDGKTQLVTAALDIAKRELQNVRLPKPLAHVRLRVDDVAPGSRPSWREVCISEIEAWGQLPSGQATNPTKPTVEVGEPPDTSWMEPPLAPATFCDKWLSEPKKKYDQMIADLTQSCEQCMKAHEHDPEPDMTCMSSGQCADDPPGPPACDLGITTSVTAGAWSGAGLLRTANDYYWGGQDFQLVVATPKGVWPFGDEYSCGATMGKATCSLEVTDARINRQGQLEVKATFTDDDNQHQVTQLAYVCDAKPTVSCVSP
jgi:hypothetical protein